MKCVDALPGSQSVDVNARRNLVAQERVSGSCLSRPHGPMYPAPGYILGHYHVSLAVQSLRIALRSEWTDPAPGCMSFAAEAQRLYMYLQSRHSVLAKGLRAFGRVAGASVQSLSHRDQGQLFLPFSIALLWRG